MLSELARLSAGLLFLGGHITDVETARRLDRANPPASRDRHSDPILRRTRRGATEVLALALIWIATPALVLLTAADLVRAL